MPELWLNFTDSNGVMRRVRVDGHKFTIGRQSNCDLAIADSRLSRSHAQIEHFAGRWELSDTGSSNGTELNGATVFDAMPIFDGSAISLGGLLLRAEITEPPVEAVQPVRTVPQNPPAVDTASRASIPIGLILAIPVLALVLVSMAGGIAYFVLARNVPAVITNNDGDDPVADGDPPSDNSKDSEKTTPEALNPTSNSGPPSLSTPKPTNLSETAKIESNGASFLRRIAQNDDKAFLTSDQAKRVGAKIKQLASSSAVFNNLKAAKQNAAELKKVAADAKLQPYFLTVAAVAKLGTTQGDIVATAKTMAPVINKLRVHVGTELADECLLLIAAYGQGEAGDTMKLRNMLQNLANDVSESSRTIRTIWFLEKRQKITAAEFDRALTFLAIGTIAQNPKDFGVNLEGLEI